MKRDEELVFRPEVDRSSRIRNPGRGWCLYVDAFRAVLPEGGVDDSGVPAYQEYWKEMDESGASKWADIFYLRVPWSEMEPKLGQYAWEDGSNVRGLIDGAIRRNLRLAFRVYVDSQDSYRQATPDYVRTQGAMGRVDSESGWWSPFVDDPVFQHLFEQFLSAFALRFDDADAVDFIDGQGLGWWGEMHHLQMRVSNGRTIEEVYKWVTMAYLRRFHQVLVGIQYGGEYLALGDWAVDQGAVIRRDSLGSPIWFSEADREPLLHHWPNVPVFAENCYHHLVTRSNWWRADGFVSVRSVLEGVVSHATEVHANTLDLRVAEDAETWMHVGRDLVEQFSLLAGYRLALTEVNLCVALGEAKTVLEHTWVNLGFGKFPGDRHGWKGRYYPAFCFWSEAAYQPELVIHLRDIDPSDWIQEQGYPYRSMVAFPSKDGDYRFMVALWDEKRERPSRIRLAHANLYHGWYYLGHVKVGR